LVDHLRAKKGSNVTYGIFGIHVVSPKILVRKKEMPMPGSKRLEASVPQVNGSLNEGN
jgi:hypothetical protein